MGNTSRHFIECYLMNIKLTTHSRGFEYLVEAIYLYNRGSKMTKEVYPKVASKFGVTVSAVERGISQLLRKEQPSYTSNLAFIGHIKRTLNTRED